jgi:hypothetical protein
MSTITSGVHFHAEGPDGVAANTIVAANARVAGNAGEARIEASGGIIIHVP